MLNFLQKFYEHTRSTLIWFVVYFVLQAVIWVALGILVILYPQTLFILVSVFFILLAALNIYLMLVFVKYIWKLKKMKDLLTIKS